VLIPDSNGEPVLLGRSSSTPEVLAHNVETVPRIFSGFARRSATTAACGLHRGARLRLVTKSNLILGMGETPDEVHRAARSYARDGHLTITPVLAASRCVTTRRAVVKPEDSSSTKQFANALGFAGVLAGPLVRPCIGSRLYAQTVASRPAYAEPATGRHRPSIGPMHDTNANNRPGSTPR